MKKEEKKVTVAMVMAQNAYRDKNDKLHREYIKHLQSSKTKRSKVVVNVIEIEKTDNGTS